MSYPPSEIAAADQHYAEVERDLSALIESYQRNLMAEPRMEALDYIVHSLACPHMEDGTKIPPHQHAGTLANMLAVAIDRLARA